MKINMVYVHRVSNIPCMLHGSDGTEV